MTLRLNSYASEDFCKIKLFPVLVWKNNIVCLVGFFKRKKNNFESKKIVFNSVKDSKGALRELVKHWQLWGSFLLKIYKLN